jgi:beta-lactamase class A
MHRACGGVFSVLGRAVRVQETEATIFDCAGGARFRLPGAPHMQPTGCVTLNRMNDFRRIVAVGGCIFGFFAVFPAAAQEDVQLDAQIKSIAAAHHGQVAFYAHNLRSGQVASLVPDEPVQTASVIKMGILLDAAEQIRAGRATLDERITLTKANQVQGSGVLGELTPPIALTLGDVLKLMVVLSDNTATNVAIDRLGLSHINETLRAAGLHQTVLYKKVYVPATEPMPPDQPKFGLGKTTAREMASIMERIVTCHLALDGSAPLPVDGRICGAILGMLRGQQDRDSLPRYLETLDTSEAGSAIGNKTGALNQVRNDVAIISTRSGPVVIAAFTWQNADQRWTGDNEAEQTIGKLGKAVIDRWSPEGLDAAALSWENPLAKSEPASKTPSP